MRKKPNFASIFLGLIIVAAVVHLLIQVALYGTGISGFAEKGISGMAIGDITDNFSISTSTIVLFAEWGLILLGIVFVYVKHKFEMNREFTDLQMFKSKKHFSGGTELDNFYELLKDRKRFRLSSAAKVFEVDEDIIEDWAKTLESSKLATLNYPRIGSPELILKENKPEITVTNS